MYGRGVLSEIIQPGECTATVTVERTFTGVFSVHAIVINNSSKNDNPIRNRNQKSLENREISGHEQRDISKGASCVKQIRQWVRCKRLLLIQQIMETVLVPDMSRQVLTPRERQVALPIALTKELLTLLLFPFSG